MLNYLIFTGTLYDTVAGVPSTIDVHLRDRFNNRLEQGNDLLEHVNIAVGGNLILVCR